jgi:UDP-N-acetylmuramoyl-tripeptide--D-alanyl-D-alanine ligase
MEFSCLSLSLDARRFPFSKEAGFSSVSIDSRSVQEGALFVALEGSANDGHCFVEAVFKSGAFGAMVDSSKLEQFDLVNIARSMGKELIVVDNTLRGLQEAARVYLEGFPGLLKIGITGSSGKSTTKEVAAAIIRNEKNTVMNQGNLNSETGVPLSAFHVRPCHEVGIFELGMNRKGEIAESAGVLKPNIALITNIGTAHIGILGSKQAIAEEKKNIFSCFTGKELALIPADDEYRDFLARDVKGRVSFYGAGSLEELGKIKNIGLEGTEIDWAGEKLRFALPGKHNLANAIAALAIAREIPCKPEAVRLGLESVKPLFGRSEIIQGPITVIRDCYNANFESFRMALEFCDSLEWVGRKIYVAADMLELGFASREAHVQIGQMLAASDADCIFLFGEGMAAAVPALKAALWEDEASLGAGTTKTFFYTRDFGELSARLNAIVKSGDMVLLKGSRGCALERLCDMPVFTGEGASCS